MPRLDKTAGPKPAPGALRLLLFGTVLAARVAWPVEDEALIDQPGAEIDAGDRADGNGAPVSVVVLPLAGNRSRRDKLGQSVRRDRTAPVEQAIVAAAQLGALGRIDAPQPYSASWISSVSPSTTFA